MSTDYIEANKTILLTGVLTLKANAELQIYKTNNLTCLPSDDSDQPGDPPSSDQSTLFA